MLYLDGIDESIKSIYKMSSNSVSSRVNSLSDLRFQYLSFLRDKAGHFVNQSPDVFISNAEDEQILVNKYLGDSALDDLNQSEILGAPFTDEERFRKIDELRSQFDRVFRVNPTFGDLFGLVIHSVFLRQTKEIDPGTGKKVKAFGGSTSDSVGVIWLAAPRPLSDMDVAELLLHELTHNLLFIDEYCCRHYNYDEILKPENYAVSAIRKTPRPLDKVVHSIVVAVELLVAREDFIKDSYPGRCTVHPGSSELANNTDIAINSVLKLKNLDNLLAPRAIEILEQCRPLVREFR